MGEYHDTEATFYGDFIIGKIRCADPVYSQVFSPSVIRIGDWDWPRPDYVCYDETNKVTYALEFKPPHQSKREYLTGLGQSLSYLQSHTYAGLIIPYFADDGFPIARFVNQTLSSQEFDQITLSLFAYNDQTREIDILHPISRTRVALASDQNANTVKTFWCWWRDLSHFELYDLLNLSFLYGDQPGDIYSEYVFPHFYRMMLEQKTKQWDGSPRNKKHSDASMRAEKQNSKIPLVQLELWTREEGRLTDSGFKLLEIGKKYGPDSKRFFDYLAYLLLVVGRHLDLINLVDKFQKLQTVASSSQEHALALEQFLDDNGCIGARKPTEVTTGAKVSYMRDEMKLWNKLGLLEKRNTRDYFFPGIGYKFNWERITNILLMQ